MPAFMTLIHPVFLISPNQGIQSAHRTQEMDASISINPVLEKVLPPHHLLKFFIYLQNF